MLNLGKTKRSWTLPLAAKTAIPTCGGYQYGAPGYGRLPTNPPNLGGCQASAPTKYNHGKSISTPQIDCPEISFWYFIVISSIFSRSTRFSCNGTFGHFTINSTRQLRKYYLKNMNVLPRQLTLLCVGDHFRLLANFFLLLAFLIFPTLLAEI